MHARTLWIVFGLLLCLAPAAVAEVEIRTLEDGAQPGPGRLEQLEWLTGRWVGEGLGARAEAVYSAPAGGQMMGMFSVGGGDGPQFYEFILIEEVENTLRLRLKHFSADFTPWEAADETTDFDLVAIEGTTAFFNGYTVHRVGEGQLEEAVFVAGEDGRYELRFHYELQD